jgi:hypothetical protein
MKTFVSALTLSLVLAFSAPAFAGTPDAPKKTEQSKTAKHQEKTAKHQEKKPMY